MKIYIAGPYTQGDVGANVGKAIAAGDIIAAMGHAPFIPHLTHFWHILRPHDYEFWLTQDFVWLAECDALFRLPGNSPGADKEEDRMRELGRPVYKHYEEVPNL